ncbi:hypothetical protein A2U01_0090631, partial [Trifolium medium]|nr:hypothetical protein [Trifolium medium]
MVVVAAPTHLHPHQSAFLSAETAAPTTPPNCNDPKRLGVA